MPINECCKDMTNRVIVSAKVSQSGLAQDGSPMVADVIHKKCKVCGRNHYELVVDTPATPQPAK